MLKTVKTEWLKIKKYPAFWWVMGITALTYPGINTMFLYIYKDLTEKKSQSGEIIKMLIGNPFIFPEAWRTIAYFSSIFVFIPAIVVIMLITNEYIYKTNRQNIIDGWSRGNFMTAKMIDVLILSATVTLLYLMVTLVIGSINTKNPDAGSFKLSYYTGLFALQTFAQLSFAFLIGMLVRKSFIALAIFAFYDIIAEPIAVNLLKFKYKSDIGNYFPLQISHRLLPKPAFLGRIDEKAYQESLDAVKYHVGYTLVFILLVWGISYWINEKRDL